MEVDLNMAAVELTLGALLDLLPMGACVIGRDLVVAQWNRTIADWMGLPDYKVIGSNLAVLAPELLTPRFHARIMDVFDLGAPRSFPPPSTSGSCLRRHARGCGTS